MKLQCDGHGPRRLHIGWCTKMIAALAVGGIAGLMLIGCSAADTGDESDINATVQAAIAGTQEAQPDTAPDLQATVEAAVVATLAATSPSTQQTQPLKATPTPGLPTPTGTPLELSFERLAETALRPSYDDLFRNNETYIGDVVYYEAQLTQVLPVPDASDQSVLLANVTRGQFFWDDSVMLRYAGPRLLEDDIIEFVGTVDGLITYEAIFGNQVTVPIITVLQARLRPDQQGEPTTTPIADTSRENPAPIGTSLNVGGWSISVLSVISDATDLVLRRNPFNDQPEPGKQFFIVEIQAKFLGDGSSRIFSHLDFGAVGDLAVSYGQFENRCGVVPNELETFTEVFSGGLLMGNLCWEVRTSDTDSLVMFADASFSRESRVWWALTEQEQTP